MACDQLVLTDATLRVLYSLLPWGRLAEEVGRARNSYDGGHLTVGELRELGRMLVDAAGDPQCIIKDEDLRTATEHFRQQLDALAGAELDRPGEVSVFVWDELRDGPLAGSLPAQAGERDQAVADAAARPAARPENRQPPRNVPSSAR